MGLSGDSGISGPSGTSGSSGTSGFSSNSGLSGWSGESGFSGWSGFGPPGDSGASGWSGKSGLSGTSGWSGMSGWSGTSGFSGQSGWSGMSGLGISGWSGLSGTSGASGLSGTSGWSGTSGFSGTWSGASGESGTSGYSGQSGTSGFSGMGESGFSGFSGDQGSSGFSGIQGFVGPLYNEVSRYQVETTSGQTAFITSASTVRLASWSRSGTTLTLIDPSHGRSNGDRVIIRNANENYLSALVVLTPTVDTFTVACNNTGGVSGAQGSYGLGFTFAHVGTPISGGTITAPAGGNVILLSARIYLAASKRSGTTYDLTVPASLTNGAGGDSGEDDLWMPVISVREQAPGSDILASAVGYTLTKAVGGDYSTFKLSSLGATTTPINIQLEF